MLLVEAALPAVATSMKLSISLADSRVHNDAWFESMRSLFQVPDWFVPLLA
jgi:hypothetical protein